MSIVYGIDSCKFNYKWIAVFGRFYYSLYPHIVVSGYYDQDLSEISHLIHFTVNNVAIINKNQLFFSELIENK